MSLSNSPEQAGERPVRPLIRLAAAGLLATAGGLHLAALPDHLQASTVAGAFFAVTAAAQLLGAVLLATQPSSRTIRAVVVGNVGVLFLWAVSRTTGLPTGGELGVREPFGLLDGFAAAAEILVVVAGLAATVHRLPGAASRRSGAWRPALALALTWGISGGAGLALADDGHHYGGGHSHGAPATGGHGESRPVPDGGHGHESPAPSPLISGASCPVGHDCDDHSH